LAGKTCRFFPFPFFGKGTVAGYSGLRFEIGHLEVSGMFLQFNAVFGGKLGQ
jgi:hypothetical protein